MEYCDCGAGLEFSPDGVHCVACYEALKAGYSPRVGDYRVSTALDGEGRHLVWRFEIDGVWEFEKALGEMEAGDLVAEKDLLHEDDEFAYWR